MARRWPTRNTASGHTISIPLLLTSRPCADSKTASSSPARRTADAHVARSDDGVNYTPAVEWKFDDGQPLLSTNTQQHWITHGDGLHLIYTRKGASNDHVLATAPPSSSPLRDSYPLVSSSAPPSRSISETGVDLGGGYAPVDVNAHETWVISSEMAFPKGREQIRA